jgi:Sulfate permease family
MNLLREYRTEWLRPDVVAGITTAAVILPKAMAYATIAGLPVEVGLYTVLVPMAVYAVLGSSRPLSVSTTTTIAILTAAELTQVVPGADAAGLLKVASTLALLVGAILLVASILKLGFIANFISDPVLAGFKAGIGLVIFVDQLPKLLGIHIDRESFFRKLLLIMRHISETSVPTLVLALVTLAIVICVGKWLPRAPAVLLAVAVVIACFSLLRLQQAGVEQWAWSRRGFRHQCTEPIPCSGPVAGGVGHRHCGGSSKSGGVSQDQSYPQSRISLGARRTGGRRRSWVPTWDPRSCGRVAPRSPLRDQPSSGLRPKPQAWYQRISPGLAGAQV